MRVRILASTISAILTFSATAPVQAKDSVTLEPSSNWNVDFGAQTCRLSRIFGEGENRHLIFFEQWTPSSDFGFTASGKGFNRFSANGRTFVQYFDEQERLRVNPMIGDVDQVGKAIIFTSLKLDEGHEPIKRVIRNQGGKRKSGDKEEKEFKPIDGLDTELAQKVQYVAFTQGSQKVIFSTGGLSEAFKVMNDCTQSLIADWGLDLEQHKTRTKDVKWTNQHAIIRKIVAKYPRVALAKGEQGIMRMRVIVDENGDVAECVIGKATDTEKLESPACGPMKQAKFEPALDEDGLPMRSFYATSITYMVSR